MNLSINVQFKEKPMGQTTLEHVNFTVTDLDRTANNLCNLFG